MNLMWSEFVKNNVIQICLCCHWDNHCHVFNCLHIQLDVQHTLNTHFNWNLHVLYSFVPFHNVCLSASVLSWFCFESGNNVHILKKIIINVAIFNIIPFLSFPINKIINYLIYFELGKFSKKQDGIYVLFNFYYG